MAYEYPSQRFQDWLSQRWVMWRGEQFDPADVPWLMGPFGNVDVIADQFVQRIATEENLRVDRDVRSGGLLATMDELELPRADAPRLHSEVAAFYEHTADFDLECWSQWNLLFRPFAGLIQRLYSRRLQQLNVPLSPLEASRGVTNEIVLLREPDTDQIRHRIWYRKLKATNRVIYSGIYSACRPPNGPVCVKVVFPLPRGNATVILSPRVDADGALHLVSAGAGFGSPGFYFLLVDSRKRYWTQYIRTFREHIKVYVDDESILRTDHEFTLWGLRALQLHYRINRRVDSGAPTLPVSAHPES